MSRQERRSAFTLIELLIVIVILGIIAAIVIPQFSVATDDAKSSALKTNLTTIRAQLQLYKLEHNDEYPPNPGGGADPTLTELTEKTDDKHDTASTDDYGPYLLSIPDNPYTSDNTIKATKTDDVQNISAWYYLRGANKDEMEFLANDKTAHHSL